MPLEEAGAVTAGVWARPDTVAVEMSCWWQRSDRQLRAPQSCAVTAEDKQHLCYEKTGGQDEIRDNNRILILTVPEGKYESLLCVGEGEEGEKANSHL